MGRAAAAAATMSGVVAVLGLGQRTVGADPPQPRPTAGEIGATAALAAADIPGRAG